MKITWLGQSGYLLESGDSRLVLDPYLSDAVNRLHGRARLAETPIDPKTIRADAVICTHAHLDHLDPDALGEMDRDMTLVTTFEGAEKGKELGFSRVKAIREGDQLLIGEWELTAVYARHTTEAFGVLLRAEGLALYFSGDTLFDRRLFEIGKEKPDAAFLCINGKLGNMDAEEAVTTAREIGARWNVPNHYGMFASNTENPRKFTGALANAFEMEFNTPYLFGKDGFQKQRGENGR